MTRWTLRGLGLLALSAGLALAQPGPKKDAPPKEPAKPAPGSLEETLDKALQNSADIKVAEAKVRDAEAELNRVRQQVLMKGTTLHNELRVAKKLLESVEAIYAQTKQGYAKNVVPLTELLPSQLAFEKQRAEVEKLEAELKAFRGEFGAHQGLIKSVAFSPDGRRIGEAHDGMVRVWDAVSGKETTLFEMAFGAAGRPEAKPAVQPEMADRVRNWMDQEVELKVNDENRMRMEDLFEILGKLTKDLVPVRMTKKGADCQYTNVTRGGKVQVGALIQSIEDNAIEGEPNSDVAIVVRDYGLLVTTKDRVPEGAVRALDFWKAKGEKKAEPTKSK